jgi:hypothetical protein
MQIPDATRTEPRAHERPRGAAVVGWAYMLRAQSRQAWVVDRGGRSVQHRPGGSFATLGTPHLHAQLLARRQNSFCSSLSMSCSHERRHFG